MLIHFINFKDVYEQKHHEISVELEKAAQALTDGSQLMDQLLNQKNSLHKELSKSQTDIQELAKA